MSLFIGKEIFIISAEQTNPTNKELSAQENVARQISNRLLNAAKKCIIPTGGRLRVVPLWPMQSDSDKIQIFVGWDSWIDGKYHCTNKLMYINVSHRDIEIDTCAFYGNVVYFIQPYFTSTSPGDTEKLIKDVEKYMFEYKAILEKNIERQY